MGSGIADLTEGKIEKAIKDFDKCRRHFSTNQARITTRRKRRLPNLLRWPCSDDTKKPFKCGKIALKIFEKYGDELAAGKIEINLGNIVSRREYHHQAENFYLSARKRFLELDEIEWLTMCGKRAGDHLFRD